MHRPRPPETPQHPLSPPEWGPSRLRAFLIGAVLVAVIATIVTLLALLGGTGGGGPASPSPSATETERR